LSNCKHEPKREKVKGEGGGRTNKPINKQMNKREKRRKGTSLLCQFIISSLPLLFSILLGISFLFLFLFFFFFFFFFFFPSSFLFSFPLWPGGSVAKQTLVGLSWKSSSERATNSSQSFMYMSGQPCRERIRMSGAASHLLPPVSLAASTRTVPRCVREKLLIQRCGRFSPFFFSTSAFCSLLRDSHG
jgi:hypothetical protein